MSLQTVADLGEHALIRRIAHGVSAPPASVIVGIGDDAAVVEPDRGTLSVLTTDTLVEGVHFDRAYVPMDAVGHRALAVSLSDLAAMGAVPRHALLSLALPPQLPVRDFDSFIGGLFSLARRHGTALVGGNITHSRDSLFIELTAVGSVKRRRLLTRDAARAGDDVYVSGTVGAAAAGLFSLQQGVTASTTPTDCQERYLRPEPRVRLGTQLGRNRAARACVDLSDGLADGIRQLSAASRLGVTIDAADVPIDPAAHRWFESQDVDPLVASLRGGDDYELLFTAPPTMRRRVAAVQRLAAGLRLTRIGRMTKDPALVVLRDGMEEELPEGYEHFRDNSGA